MRVTSDWADASLGAEWVDLAGAIHPRLGSGSTRNPALVQARFSASKPAVSDFGEPLEVEGLRFRRTTVPEGMRLWVRTHVSQHTLLIELPEVVASRQATERRRPTSVLPQPHRK